MLPSAVSLRTKSRAFLAAAPVLSSALALGLTNVSARAAVPAPGSWSLLFDDEFNGNSLDQMKWNYNYPWSQHGLADDSVEQASQVSVGSGVMTFTAVNSGQTYGGTWYNYTSGAVNTEGKLNFSYGYIEASQKMSSQQGTWAALWMLQNGWPPEIDVEEVPAFSSNPTQYNTAYHYNNSGSSTAQSAGPGLVTESNLSSAYNNYGVDWEPNSLTFYFNGNVVGSVSGSQANIAQAAGMYLLLDLGVGGWPGEPSGSTFPTTMETDWVRVWQHPASGASTVNNFTSTVSGSWDTTGNWSNGSVGGSPNLSTVTAGFTAVGSSPIDVSWTGSRTVNGLTFSSPTAYIIGGATATGDAAGVVTGSGAGLMITSADGVAGGAETIYVTQTAAATGGTTINARVEVPDPTLTLNVTNSSTAQLKFNGDMIGTGSLLLSSGPVTIGGNDQMSGSVTVAGGTALTVSGQLSASSNLLIASGSVALASGGSVVSTGYSSVGSTGGSTGFLNAAGNITADNDFNVGDVNGATGIMNLSGGTLAVTTFYVGKYGNANGTVNQTGGAVTPLGGNDWRIGGGGSSADSAAVGVYNLSGGSFTTTGNFQVGAYGQGTFTQTAGTVTVGSYLSIGRFTGATGTYNISSGSLTANAVPALIVGEQGTGTLLVGGTAAVNAKLLSIAHSDGTNAAGTVTQGVPGVTSTSIVTATTGVEFGTAASGSAVVTGIYNLDAGTLKTFSITQNPSAGVSGTLNLDGGTIAATATNPNTFLTGLTAAKVQQYGAIISAGTGISVTISQNLRHDSSGPATDGGLTKSGTGTLILDGVQSTYTGKTAISGGTLRLSNAPMLPAGGEVLDLDASTVTGANGALVGSLTDESMSQNNAAVTVAGDSPTLNAANSTGGLNGHSTINFNAGSQGLTTAAAVGISGNASRTVFSVIRRDGTGSMTTHIGTYGSDTDYGISDQAGNLYLPYTDGNDSTTTAQPAGTWELEEAVHTTGGTDVGYVNGVQTTSATLATLNTTNSPAQIGYRTGDGLQSTGDFAEMLVYNTALTTAQRQAVETYLDYKWFGSAITPATNILPSTTAVSVASLSTLDLNGNNQTIASLTGVSTSFVTLGTGNLTISGAANTEFDGLISGAGSLTEQGPSTLTLTKTETFTGLTTISGGGITLNTSGSFTGNVSVLAGGTLTFGIDPITGVYTRKAGTLSIAGQVNVAPAANHINRILLSVAGLSFGGNSTNWTGKLDLANNDMDVQNAGPAGLANINSEIAQGSAGGTWTGTGGIVSSVAGGLTTLGSIINNVNGNPLYGNGTTLGLFDGVSPGVNDVLVKYTYYGDANLDGQVDGSDYTLIDNGFNNGLTGWQNGDFNYDGKVDGSDYTLIDNAFNTQGENLTTTALLASTTSNFAAASSVPEPTPLGLTLLATAPFVSLRRRRTSGKLINVPKPDKTNALNKIRLAVCPRGCTVLRCRVSDVSFLIAASLRSYGQAKEAYHHGVQRRQHVGS